MLHPGSSLRLLLGLWSLFTLLPDAHEASLLPPVLCSSPWIPARQIKNLRWKKKNITASSWKSCELVKTEMSQACFNSYASFWSSSAQKLKPLSVLTRSNLLTERLKNEFILDRSKKGSLLLLQANTTSRTLIWDEFFTCIPQDHFQVWHDKITGTVLHRHQSLQRDIYLLERSMFPFEENAAETSGIHFKLAAAWFAECIWSKIDVFLGGYAIEEKVDGVCYFQYL